MRTLKALLFIVAPLVGITIVLMNVLIPEPEATPEVAALQMKYEDAGIVHARGNLTLLKEDPNNLQYLYNLVHHYYNSNERDRTFFDYELKEAGYAIPYDFKARTTSNDTLEADNALFAMAVYYLENGQTTGSREKLDSIHDKDRPFYRHLQGAIYERDRLLHYAEREYLAEIQEHGENAFSVMAISRLAHYLGDHNTMAEVLVEPNAKQYIPHYIQRIHYLNTKQWQNYVKALGEGELSKISLPGWIGATLVFLTWLFFLVRVSLFSSFKWGRTIPVIAASAIFTVGCLFFYDSIYLVGFYHSDTLIIDLLYSIFGIGLIEESVKILPLVLILFLRKEWLKKPMDYIIIASLSGLTFAFIENFGYFGFDDLNRIHGRAIFTSILHIVLTAIPAYGLMIAKFKPNTSKWTPFYYFGLSMVVHGLYDFFFISWLSYNYWIWSYAIWFIAIFAFVSMINNALNNSPDFDITKSKKLSSVGLTLLIGLTVVFLYDIILRALLLGPTVGNEYAFDLFLYSYIFVPVLAIIFNKIDLVKGYWEPINIHGAKRIFRLEDTLGSDLMLTPFKANHQIANQLPRLGKIVSRELIKEDPNWFLVELDEQINHQGKSIKFALVKPKADNDVFNDERILTHLKLVPTVADQADTNNAYSTDWIYSEIKQ